MQTTLEIYWRACAAIKSDDFTTRTNGIQTLMDLSLNAEIPSIREAATRTLETSFNAKVTHATAPASDRICQ